MATAGVPPRHCAPMTPAVAALQRAKVAFTLHEYSHQSVPSDHAGFGLEAARALQVPSQQLLKTLLVAADPQERRLVVACVPVDRQLDLRALAGILGVKKVELATPAQAERVTGYVVGGISPFGQRKRLPTVIDDSVQQFERVFVSGGRRGLQIRLSLRDLVDLCEARLAAIGRTH